MQRAWIVTGLVVVLGRVASEVSGHGGSVGVHTHVEVYRPGCEHLVTMASEVRSSVGSLFGALGEVGSRAVG
jgi:hypothetical protein